VLSNEKTWVRPATEDVEFIVCRPAGISQSQMLARAGGLLRCRRARSRQFGSAMFGETAWDMLLTLYVSDVEAMTLSHLAQLVEAPPSSALRWIEYLEAQRLARRDAHPSDRRSALVKLTDKGRASLELYLTETLEFMP
jgi:DNA-binding MarR family transcriptional regulator